MVDFKFYLNKQGPQGVQGTQGEPGFSPSITVDTNTANEYKLLITTEDDSFTTDNLRGTAIDDQGGTYVRYDQDNESMYAGNPDYADTTTYGMVQLASDVEITTGASDKVVTADQLKDAVDNLEEMITTATSSVGDGVLTITDGTNTLGTFSANQSTNVTITTPPQVTPNNGTLTIQQDGTTVGSFGANSSTNTTVNITSPSVGNGTVTFTQGSTTLGSFSVNQSTNQTITIPESSVTVDSSLSTTSTNPVQNKVITDALNTKADSTSLSSYLTSTNVSTVALTGDYDDLTNKPTITTVNDSAITFNYGTTEIGSITLNQSSTQTITVPESSSPTITTTLSSSSTNDEVPGALTVYNAVQAATPTNMVTLNTEQTITAKKSIQGSSSLNTALLKVYNTSSAPNIGDYRLMFNAYGGGSINIGWVRNSSASLLPYIGDESNRDFMVKTTGERLILASYGGVDSLKFRKLSSHYEGGYQGTDYTVIHSGNISDYVPGGGASIDDTTTSTTSVYSSTKCVNTFISSEDIRNVKEVTEAEYETTVPSQGTMYVISDAPEIGLNVDLSNLSSAGNKVIDGQWVYSSTTLINNQTAPTTDFDVDLSTYLPDDNYIYEVLFCGYCSTGTTSGNIHQLRLSSSIVQTVVQLAYAITRADNYSTGGGNCILPISADKKVIVRGYSNNTGNYTLYARGYRRIGTNA